MNNTELMLIKAPHFQGGHSIVGMSLSDALKVPFPLQMCYLEKRALDLGYDPATLWPWYTPMIKE